MWKPWTGEPTDTSTPGHACLLDPRHAQTLAPGHLLSSTSSPAAMGWHWISGKGKHHHEAGSSTGRNRSRSTPPPAPFNISPPAAAPRSRPYVKAEICQRYWETATPLPWSDVHLPNNWHLSADRVPIPPIPVSGRARREEINRRRARLPPDLVHDARYALDSPLWDTWLRDEHDLRRQSFFAGRAPSPPRARSGSRARALSPPQQRGRARIRGTPTPSPSPSPPPPPPMTAEEEEELVRRVLEDSVHDHDEAQWEGLEEMMALSAAGDVAIPQAVVKEEVVKEEPVVDPNFAAMVGQIWAWTDTVPCTPEHSPSPPREEVVQATPAMQPPQGPPAHLWQPPPYVDLTRDDDEEDDDA